MSQARDAAVLAALNTFEAAVTGSSAALLTRGGSLLAGKSPSSDARELFAVMAATMFGAAEAGTADFGHELHDVEAHLEGASFTAVAAGRKLVLVAYVKGASPSEQARAHLHECARTVAALFDPRP